MATDTSSNPAVRRAGAAAALLVLGILIGFGLSRAFPTRTAAGPPPLGQEQLELAEERLRSELQLSLVGFFRLVEFRDFAESGADVTIVVAVPSDAPRDRAIAAAASARALRVPTVAVDASERRKWSAAAVRLAGLLSEVDPQVAEGFRQVQAFSREHPWPEQAGIGATARSEWAEAAVVDRWVALNQTLSARVVSLLSQMNAGA